MINESQARQYCREDITLIKNYAEAIADQTSTWICHHINGEPFTGFCKKDLKKMNMYYKRPASELMFVTRSEHMTRHMKGKKGKIFSDTHKQKLSESQKGKILSDAHKQKLSESHKGRTSPLKGKHHSEATRRKISESLKGKTRKHLSAETRRKISESHKGKHLSEETRKKMAESHRRVKCL